MSKRTRSQYEYNHVPNRQEPQLTKPGQIYLKSYRQLTQENQQLIMSIHQLKNKNQQINNKLQEKIKASKAHLKSQSSSTQLNSNPSKEHFNLHNKFYRVNQTPGNIVNTQQQIKKDDYSKNEQPLFIKSTKLKERNNSAYRLIKESHLKSLDQMEKEGYQKQNKKTERKKAIFDEDIEITPQKQKQNQKYILKQPSTKKLETPVKKTQKNLVYLPIAKEQKQQMIEKHNKKISELKPEPPKKQQKDNSPYKADRLRRALQKQNSVYYLQSQYKEIDSDTQQPQIKRKSTLRK